MLRHRSQSQPDKIAFQFLLNGETEKASLTYKDLDLEAQKIAAKLQQMSKNIGERALLLYSPGLEFIVAFFGCLYAGIIAIPLGLPRRNEKMTKLQKIIADAQPSLILTTLSFFNTKKNQFGQNSELASIKWLLTDNMPVDSASQWQEQTICSDTIAFLQYTSGSTGEPKGVILTHGNLIYNQRIIKAAFKHTKTAIVVGWLPLFHDMGLIGNILQSLFLSIPCILMSPVAFLQQPFRWLQTISSFKATTSGGPNFAYDLCVQKITDEQKKKLDLSSWEVAFIGAEPIQAETLKRFASTFKSCGFRWEAFYPCYGLAETTLFVSGGLKTQPPIVSYIDDVALRKNQVLTSINKRKGDREIVSCGQPWLDTKVMIVNPESLNLCPEGAVGEIWISGSSVAQGYWNLKNETKQTFLAHLTGTDEEPFLRTGDLGFLQNGELFVTGRLKDTIIIRGCNHYPQDIELTVEESHLALRKGGGAVFSVKIKGKERLIVVHEVERTQLRKLNVNEVIESIRYNVATQHALQVHIAKLVNPGSIPKTSSGKIRRHACRDAFLNGSLRVATDPYSIEK